MPNARPFQDQRDSSPRTAEPRGRQSAAFKPVALPALVAAVRSNGRPQPRKPAFRDIPAILREAPLD